MPPLSDPSACPSPRRLSALGLALGALSALCAPPPAMAGNAFDQALAENPIQAYHPNFMAIASDHGESKVQFLVSFQYNLTPFAKDAFGLGPYRFDGFNFVYDGLYDFDSMTRHSQPVVSRLQNPGWVFSFRAPEGPRAWGLDGWDAGWFHESNGQVVDKKADYDALYAKIGQAATDSVSRGWDYWYLSPRFTWRGDSLRLRFSPALRIYDGSEAANYTPAEQDIFWKAGAPPSTIYDYDGLRAQASAEWLPPHRGLSYVGLDASVRTGYNSGHFAQNWSEHLVFTVKTWHLPLFVYFDNGYGPYISDYSTWSQGWGLGVRYWGP